MTSLAESNETKDICGAQWLLLWTTAAYAPETPSKDDKSALDTFFGGFKDLCHKGPYAQCYKQAVEQQGRPPTSSRRELMMWLCMAENTALREAGLPTKRCRYQELMTRWRYQDGYL
eukprot:TRINITY_DN76465_c0_g1_i1.p1 TRINITY_DN76465_c0_g1~~TRINITY_DN76465_c0_g1_i1.p1  ORF type:complete len:117 (+),score=18.71 TRINITY_DN76465_c0_g1_i1:133-483(+)